MMLKRTELCEANHTVTAEILERAESNYGIGLFDRTMAVQCLCQSTIGAALSCTDFKQLRGEQIALKEAAGRSLSNRGSKLMSRSSNDSKSSKPL